MSKKGIIKKFIERKGFGFIESEGEEIFFHVSEIMGKKDILLFEGMEVEFSINTDKNGRKAAKRISITPVNFIPSDTADLLSKVNIENYSLKLNKITYFDGQKFAFYIPPNKKFRQHELDNFSTNFPKIDFDTIVKRLKKSLDQTGLVVRSLTFRTDWRMAVGLGGASVYETSITLHHIYGIPYIPGSAIKGMLRNWIIAKYFNNKEKEAYKNDIGFCQIFGSPAESILGEHQGLIYFFDAFPINKPDIKRDIMNPHYGSYYMKGEAPKDDENPVPVSFLTVENAKFQFCIGIRPEKNQQIKSGKFKGQKPLDLVVELLTEALREYGIGAKTAVGYGYLSSK